MIRLIALAALALFGCSEPRFGAGADASADASDSGPDASEGGRQGDTGPMSACPACDAAALCVPERRECVDFCAMPAELPNSGPMLPRIPCGGETDLESGKVIELSFAKTCQNTCLLRCRWQGLFCNGYECADYCEQPERITECLDETTGCGASADPAHQLTCQHARCDEVRSLGCVADASLCPNGFTPQCGDVVCSNDCEAKNLFDGYCDDGAFAGSSTDFCAWGTDCGDCGPRTGQPRAVDVGEIALGDLCPSSFRCAGNTLREANSVIVNGSWCRPLGDESDKASRCLLDCSTEGEECAAGFECRVVDFQDSQGRSGRACFPVEACDAAVP